MTPGTVAPLSMGYSRQEYWSGLPFPSPLNLFRSRFSNLTNSEPYLLEMHTGIEQCLGSVSCQKEEEKEERGREGEGGDRGGRGKEETEKEKEKEGKKIEKLRKETGGEG